MKKILEHLESLAQLLGKKLFRIGDVDVTLATLAIFVLTLLVALLVSRVIKRTLVRMLVSRVRSGDEGSAYALGRIAQYATIVAGFLVALEAVGISLSTLAALGAVFAVGLGFGLQNIAQNFVSGLILLFERPVAKGDVVIVDGTFGVVDEISIRSTRIMTFDQIAMIVPNNKLVSEVVENRSEPTRTYRVRIDVRVEYGADSRLVERLLEEVASSHESVLEKPEPSVFFVDFGDNGMEFQVCVWLDDPMIALGVQSTLRHEISRKLAANGVAIPVPRRDVTLHQSGPRNE